MAQLPPIPTRAALTMTPLPSFSHMLMNSLQHASERLTDGQLIYGPIAALWDEYLQTDAVRKLPAKLRNPLKALCNDISITTQKHFDTFLAGTAPLSQTNSTIYNSMNPSIPSISTTSLLPAPEACRPDGVFNPNQWLIRQLLPRNDLSSSGCPGRRGTRTAAAWTARRTAPACGPGWGPRGA